MVEALHRVPTRDLAVHLDKAFGTPGTFARLEGRLRDLPFPASFRPFAAYESEATALYVFEHSLVPGLLQTSGYARAVLATRPNSTPEDLIGLRRRRLRILTRTAPGRRGGLTDGRAASMTRLGTVRGAGRAAREHAERPAPGWPAVILRVVGSGLLIATAAIHLDLYLTGYRTIPTIGWLFLLQVIAAFGLGLAVLAIPAGWLPECQPGWRPRREPASPSLPSAATSCRSGPGCSGSRRSARAPASPLA